jgi:hypothetical protein
MGAIIQAIQWGWKLAEINPDGSKATPGQRLYAFATNGGGAITSRMVVVAMFPILTTIVGLMWSDLRDGQREVLKTVTDQGKSIVVNSALIDGIKTGQQRMWVKLGTHDQIIGEIDHRVTRLESCQPNCAPR